MNGRTDEVLGSVNSVALTKTRKKDVRQVLFCPIRFGSICVDSTQFDSIQGMNEQLFTFWFEMNRGSKRKKARKRKKKRNKIP